MSPSAQTNRLQILDKGEVYSLFARPEFTAEERLTYFSLSPIESAALSSLGANSRIYCILQLGYFKARQQFFTLDVHTVRADVAYIGQRYFPDYKLDNQISGQPASSSTWSQVMRSPLVAGLSG